jgi:preprotein translocase subunit YajC
MLISPAYAQDVAGGGGDFFVSVLPLVLIFVVFYFLLIRPQQKKVKEHKSMVEALRRGDRVVTAGGILGQVVRVVDNEVEVEIAKDVRVKVVKHTITDVLSRTEPANQAKPSRKKGKAAADKAGEDAAPAADPEPETADSGETDTQEKKD